ncbi:MAG: hypothetical protein IPF59_06055 [Ignavibacteria bacterium]|nr:hypothetical protein [Ignavibacteria bacterium]
MTFTLKSLVMCMLAAIMAASSLTAQDTLTIRSYRVVDVCSSERRWLIAPTLGIVRSQDSLMSFDITIGYDTAVTRPTDVLTEGTLSANLDYKPTLNTVVPGEMRIAGFNIVRPMIGDKPIVAISGDFKGSCSDLDSLSIPWPVTFNEEFKRTISVYTIEPILAVANAKTRTNVGVFALGDSVVIRGKDSLGSVSSLVSLIDLSSVKASATYTIQDTNVAVIESVSLTDANLIEIERINRGKVIVHFSQQGITRPRVLINLRSVTAAENVRTKIDMELKINDSCGCVKPGLVDTIDVICENPMVYVSSSADEDTADLLVADQSIRCQCYHGQTNAINVYSIDGMLVATTGIRPESETFLSIDGLPHGAYIIVGHCGSKKSVTLKMK